MAPQNLPCPCCGQETQLIATEGGSGYTRYSYRHTYKQTDGCRATSGDWPSAEKAAEAWQRRPSPWISVDDIMPDHQDEVFILVENGSDWGIVNATYKPSTGSWITHANTGGMRVTHWMSIPDPPILTLSS